MYTQQNKLVHFPSPSFIKIFKTHRNPSFTHLNTHGNMLLSHRYSLCFKNNQWIFLNALKLTPEKMQEKGKTQKLK